MYHRTRRASDCRLRAVNLEEEGGYAVLSAQQLPSRLLFIRSYLKTLKREQDTNQMISIEEENHLFQEVQSFILAPHFFWAVWSVVNAMTSTIRFGYWEYAMDRFDSYYRWKNMLINNTPTVEQPVKRKLDDMEG